MTRIGGSLAVGVVLGVAVCLAAVGAVSHAADARSHVAAGTELTGGERAANAAGPAPSLELAQTAFGNVFLANESVAIGVETDASAVDWAVHDYRGRLVGNGTAAVDGERTLSLPVEAVGHYTVRVRTATGAPASTTRTTAAVLPADEFENDDDFFGMSTQFNAGWDHELMAVMDAAGVAAVREDSGWARIEQRRGVYDFGPSDDYMSPLAERGFDRLYILAYGNSLYDPGDGGYFAIPYTDGYRRGFANFSAAAATHYGAVDYVEVWNEPNLATFANGPTGTDPAAYAALLEATYPAVTAARENVTVLGGAAAANYSESTPSELDRRWWRGLLEAGGASFMDAMSVHLYRPEPTGFERDLDRLRALTREHNDGEALPIWVTELGWPASPTNPGGFSETTQARNLVRSYARLGAAGAERYYWYTLRDAPLDGETTPQTAEWNTQGGLLRGPDHPDGRATPRPGLTAYAVMTRQLAGSDVVESASDPVQQYVFANGSDRTRVLWAGNRTDVTVRTDEPVTVTSTTGEATRLHPRGGEVYLTVGRDPLYLAGNATRISRGAPVSVSGSLTSDGDRDDLTVGVDRDSPFGAVTHRVGDRTVTVSTANGSTASLALPPSYRGRAATAVDVVSVDGRPVGRLSTPVGVPTARFGDPPSLTGLTVETKNPDAGVFTEVGDVGTRHSAFEAVVRDGRYCWRSDVSAGLPGNGLYVDLPDGHVDGLDEPVSVTVRYVDAGDGEIALQYDGPGDGAAWGGSVETTGAGEWRTHTFTLPAATLRNGLGSGHDFRLLFDGGAGDVCLGTVTVGTDAAPALAAPDGAADVVTTTGLSGTDRGPTAGEPGTDPIETGTDPTGTEPTGTGPVGATTERPAGTSSGSGAGFGASVALLAGFVALTVVGRVRAHR